MATKVRDPRSIITPDAFGISDDLLGMPLAKPRQRLIAIVIDLVVIGLLTVFTSGLGLFIWGAVALFLLRMAFRRPKQKMGQVTSFLFRGSTGCLGLMILVIVVAVAMVSAIAEDVEEFAPGISEFANPDFWEESRLGQAMQDADSREELGAAAMDALEALGEDDSMSDEEKLQALISGIAANAPGLIEDPEGFVRSLTDGEDEAGLETANLSEEEIVAAEVAELSLTEAAERYEALLDDPEEARDGELTALELRVLAAVAPDTLEDLQDAVAAAERRQIRAEEELDSVEADAAEAGSFVALLRDIWDQAGSAIGLWSIYFTVTLALFKGFTVGKRIMGIRVVRLDGEPITWWAAFERGGGYVAGIATGLLGFVQIFWDPNRQCVHDKIGGTTGSTHGERKETTPATKARG